MRLFILTVIALLSISSCKSTYTETAGVENTTSISSGRNTAMPKAIVYKVQPEYLDKVPVRLDAGKIRLLSFPAPTDITPSTAPIELIDGFYLDRQGIDINTMFLSVTRDEYAAMASTPSAADIMEMVLPMSFVSEIVVLPITTAEAINNPDVVKRLISQGFPNCKVYHGRQLVIGNPPVIGTDY